METVIVMHVRYETSRVWDVKMSHTVRCSCSNPSSVSLSELRSVSNSKAILDLFKYLVLRKGCTKVDISLIEYIKFYQESDYVKFCVVYVPKPNMTSAQELESSEIEVSAIKAFSFIQNVKRDNPLSNIKHH